jgi:hypothetical protein
MLAAAQFVKQKTGALPAVKLVSTTQFVVPRLVFAWSV